MEDCAHVAGPDRAPPARPQGSKTKRPALCQAETWGRRKISSLALTFPFPLPIVISYTEAASWGERSHQLPELNQRALSFVPLHIILLSWWSLRKHILHSFANWGIFHILRLRLMFHLSTGWDLFSNSMLSRLLAQSGSPAARDSLRGDQNLVFLRVHVIPSVK